MKNDLSEFIPWILAIFFVLFLIACCSWLYRCIQKCDDQCPGLLPARSPLCNPNLPMTPFQSTRHTRNNCEAGRRLTCQRATNDENEPSGSQQCILSSSSVVHYHGQKVPPYVSFSDRPPPPTYEEACSSSSTTALANTTNTENPGQTVASIDTTNLIATDHNTPPTTAATATDPDSVELGGETAALSITNSTNRDDRPNEIVDVVNESVAIDNPQDEPLINDEDEDDDELHDVVVETTTPSQPSAASEEVTRREISDVLL